MLTTDGPTLSTSVVKSGRFTVGAADADCDTNGRHTASAAAAMNLRSEKLLICWGPRIGLLGRLVFYGRSKLLQCGLRHFTQQGNPEIPAALD